MGVGNPPCASSLHPCRDTLETIVAEGCHRDTASSLHPCRDTLETPDEQHRTVPSSSLHPCRDTLETKDISLAKNSSLPHFIRAETRLKPQDVAEHHRRLPHFIRAETRLKLSIPELSQYPLPHFIRAETRLKPHPADLSHRDAFLTSSVQRHA